MRNLPSAEIPDDDDEVKQNSQINLFSYIYITRSNSQNNFKQCYKINFMTSVENSH